MLTEGMYVADRYEIIGKVGAGGMSDVYKAKDLTLGRFVAIKVLKPEFSDDINFVTKFRTEAQSAAGLEHPNIVNIYDVGSENGMHFIIMEFVEGITLKTYIEKKGQLTFKEAVSIAIQVGRGIEAAHAKSIIHRDIKPQNIIISTEGKVKVTDFGIARAATTNTINSDVMGSVHYSSPEQARNGFVDGKSDIYSLGIVMYEMVTGKVPFDGDTTVAVAIQHLQEEMVAPSAYARNLPVSMEKIILKCTQKNPDRRYESMTALLADLRKALISPDEDFVVMVPIGGQDKTRIIQREDVQQIKKETAGIRIQPERVIEPVAEEEYDEDDEDEDDELDDDGDLNPKMEKAITIMGIVAAVIIVGIIILLLVNLLGGFKSKPKTNSETKTNTEASKDSEDESEDKKETGKDSENKTEEKVPVPDLAGKTYEEAQAELNKLGIGIQKGQQISSDEYEEGQIVSHRPAAGEKVEKHTTIIVDISTGEGTITVPPVVGMTDAEAIAALSSASFDYQKNYSYSDTVEEGHVISQSPEGNSNAKKGEKVILEISQGSELLTVPDVVNSIKTEAQAKEMLKDFTVTTSSGYSDHFSPGMVMGQSLESGQKVPRGTTINIVISQGPEPEQIVKPATYRFSVTIDSPESDISNISGADIVLYDTSGNIIETWYDQDISKFKGGLKISKSGILADKGKLVITWLDLNGDELSTQSENLDFSKES